MVLVDTSHASVTASALYLWYHAGCAAEEPQQSGAAHLLEHMLFKGAGDHGPGEAAARIEGLGGDLNAYTSYEQTVLHATVPAGREAEALTLLADMGSRPRLDARQLARERLVVVEEIRGAQDDPTQVLADAIRARTWAGHPYGRPVLGDEATVRGMTRARLAAFHDRFYTPANAILAVAGPVDPDGIVALAAQHLRGRPPATPPARRAPAPSADRVFALDLGFDERVVEIAFPVPGHGHPDTAAIDLLVSALGEGEAALLSAELKVARELAYDTWAYYESEPDHSLVVLGLSAWEGRAADAAAALAGLVARVRRDGISPAALHRARVAALASRIRDRETADGRAHRAAWYQAFFGDPASEATYEASIMRVTPADVRRVAATWLRPEAAVIGAVAPAVALGRDALARAAARGFEEAPGPRAVTSPAIVRQVWPSGVTVVIEPDPEAELAAVSVLGVGGAIAEGPRNGGLSDAWATSVVQGAGRREALGFAAAVEERAGVLVAWAARNSCGVSASFPAGELAGGIELLGDALCAPRFDRDAVARVRAELIDAQEVEEDSPGELAWDLAWQALYRGHPWGRPGNGTPAGGGRITPGRLRASHRRVMAGGNLVIAVAGGVDPDDVFGWLARALEGLPTGGPVPWNPPSLPEVFRRSRRRVVSRAQAHQVYAFPAPGWGQPDLPAAMLAEGVLGGQGGRLFSAVREERGLAYDVSASSVAGLGGGALLVSLATDPDRVEEAREAVWEQLESVAYDLVSDEELSRVKARVVDGAAVGLQRASARAEHMSAAERYGLGAARYRELLAAPGRVSAEALRDLARRVLRPDRCATVLVGPDR